MITTRQAERMESLIYRYGPLPPLKLRAGKLVAATGADKKNVGGVRRFVLPVGIGDACVVEDVTPAELEEAAKFMLARAAEMHA
jgi:3-dehydroquinate synthase